MTQTVALGADQAPPSFGMSEVWDASRIRALDRSGQSLVMDRISGRWALVPASDAHLVPLLASDPGGELGSEASARLQALRTALQELGLGFEGTERKFSALNTLILKLTNACNLACTYCYDHEDMEKATVLGVSNALLAIGQALAIAPGKLSVILHGGEPTLLWSQIEQIIVEGEKLAKRYGNRIQFTGQTNLTRLDTRMVDFSNSHGILWGVSIDGSAKYHDKFRVDHQGNGSFSQYLRALEKFPDFVRSCSVMTTVTLQNAAHLLEIGRYFHQLGICAWDWSLFQPIGRARASASIFEPDTADICSSWLELFEAVESGEFDGFQVFPVTKYIDNFLSGPGDNMCMRSECGAARDLLSISADGTIEACDCIDPKGCLSGLGNLETGSLSEALGSPVAQKIRSRDLSAQAPCKDCIWYGVCGGTCLAHAGGVDAVWSAACEVAKTAFDAISASIARDDRLVRYMASIGV